MCGICGVIDFRKPVDRQLVQRMADVIRHRGPDGEGFYFNEGSRPSVGLGARRLAIIDVVAGDQPISNEDGTVHVVYNGEIFNFPELRAELESYGHVFRTHCDTEAVVHAYEQWGDDAPAHFNGMFAFAVWDARRNRLLLGRDRLGVKPLVYYQDGDRLIFGSEIKALLEDCSVPRQVDPDALMQYLSFFSVPEPSALLQGIRRLPPGHVMVVENGTVTVTQYWQVEFEESPARSDNQWLDELDALLADSVRIRLSSEVPLGVFLSGGIDSGLIVAMMARTGADILSSSIEFSPGYSESKRARAVASAFHTDHRDTVVSCEQALAALPDMVWHHDEPSQSLIQTYFVAKSARERMTAALSGLGADELFTGYPGHVAAQRFRMLEGVPRWARQGVNKLLATSRSNWAERAGRFLASADTAPVLRFASHYLHATSQADRRRFASDELLAAADPDAATQYLLGLFAQARDPDFRGKLLFVDQKAYLVNELLRTCDSMSMAHSLEVRTPFLDYRLVELAARMPMRMKIRGFTTKYALRKLAERVLPAGIARRPKIGFTVPLNNWIGPASEEFVRDHLDVSSLDRHGLFDSAQVGRMVADHFGGRANYSHWIMMLLTFEIWHRLVIEQSSSTPARAVAGAR